MRLAARRTALLLGLAATLGSSVLSAQSVRLESPTRFGIGGSAMAVGLRNVSGLAATVRLTDARWLHVDAELAAFSSFTGPRGAGCYDFDLCVRTTDEPLALASTGVRAAVPLRGRWSLVADAAALYGRWDVMRPDDTIATERALSSSLGLGLGWRSRRGAYAVDLRAVHVGTPGGGTLAPRLTLWRTF